MRFACGHVVENNNSAFRIVITVATESFLARIQTNTIILERKYQFGGIYSVIPNSTLFV